MAKTIACADCGKAMCKAKGSLPEGRARCHECRRSRRPKCRNCGGPTRGDVCRTCYANPQGPLTCRSCGHRIGRGAGSLPQGEATCLQCRERPAREQRTPCLGCGVTSWGERCRACYDAHVKSTADPEAARQRKRDHARRQRRERAAPGLTTQARRNLGAKWRAQARRCTYCDALATQVDHVIPLALGGTHYEGNLTPCCAPCNMRKSDSLLSEWKHSVRVKRQIVEPPPLPPLAARPKARARRWAAPQPLFPRSELGYYHAKPKALKPCAECGLVFGGHPARRFCKKACADRYARKAARRTERGRQRRREQKARARARRRQTPGVPQPRAA